MAIPKFLKPFMTIEALIGLAIAFHKKIWRLVELGGDVDFIATYVDNIWAFAGKAWTFFSADWGTWFVVAFGLGLVVHSYYRHRKRPEQKPTEEEKPSVSELQYVLDRQDEHINGLIHAPHKWVRKYFDAHSPYIDIHFDLVNSSVYELAYENLQGRLFYRDDPIEPRPDIISHEAILKSGSQGAFALRQFISADLRDLLVSQCGQLQELAPSENFCIRFSYSNRHGEKKDACWTILPELFDISEPVEEEGPDWTLSQAHAYWATVTDRSETFNSELEQAAFDENIDIWGKRDYLHDTVFEPIPSGHWIKSRLDIDPAVLFTDEDVGEESILEHSRTEPKNKTDLGITQYWYLKVSSKQIKERFG